MCMIIFCATEKKKFLDSWFERQLEAIKVFWMFVAQ